MLLWNTCLLIAAVTSSWLLPTNEVSGVFTQTRTADSREYVSHGTYHLIPGKSFEWVTHDPFETYFFSDRVKYIYTNEDEVVEKKLEDLPMGSMFVGKTDEELIAMFEEHKDNSRIKSFIEDFQVRDHEIQIYFTNKTNIKLEFKDDNRE